MLKNSIETFCGELTGTILASLNAVHCMCGYNFEKDLCVFWGQTLCIPTGLSSNVALLKPYNILYSQFYV